jgi:hypothetical protein
MLAERADASRRADSTLRTPPGVAGPSGCRARARSAPQIATATDDAPARRREPGTRCLYPLCAIQSPHSPPVRVLEPKGMEHADVPMTVTSAAGCTSFTNEVTKNGQRLPRGACRLLLRRTMGGPGLGGCSTALPLLGGKKKPHGDSLRAELAAPPPTVLVPCHVRSTWHPNSPPASLPKSITCPPALGRRGFARAAKPRRSP